MAAKQPAMSPSELPVAEVLDRATGARRAEADELLAILGEIGRSVGLRRRCSCHQPPTG
jgi:hypothetical protein